MRNSHQLQVIECVTTRTDETLAPKSLEDAIQARIQVQWFQVFIVNLTVDGLVSTISCPFLHPQKFPTFLQTQLHTFQVRTPLAALYCLHKNPQLVSSAVHAFYTRDAIDVKVCLFCASDLLMYGFTGACDQNSASMTHFPAATAVTANVTATRCLYAQLRRQRFTCPRSYESAMPSPSSPDSLPAELGMKLAVGFEMLAVAATKRNKMAAAASTAGRPFSLCFLRSVDCLRLSLNCRIFSEDVTLLPNWKQFHNSLLTLGYFQVSPVD